ncbi:hypothetical protein GJ744_001323 [Endocarpon pusillum]|uniref:Uncharacterized protein n=1 Tax=Endocarpon pusillum TaxID=364733 RepID=A0A8H7ANL3_9EURO|nr:hypothetical protein GJ744_001323 [Endocarpon pusillum]
MERAKAQRVPGLASYYGSPRAAQHLSNSAILETPSSCFDRYLEFCALPRSPRPDCISVNGEEHSCSTFKLAPLPLKQRLTSWNVGIEVGTGLKAITQEALCWTANKNLEGVRIINSNLKNSYLVLAAYLQMRNAVQFKVFLKHNNIIQLYLKEQRKAFRIPGRIPGAT